MSCIDRPYWRAVLVGISIFRCAREGDGQGEGVGRAKLERLCERGLQGSDSVSRGIKSEVC